MVDPPMLKRYASWDEERREAFDNVLDMMEEAAPRQAEVFKKCELEDHRRTKADYEALAAEAERLRGHRDGPVHWRAINMAHRRALNFMREHAGPWVDESSSVGY